MGNSRLAGAAVLLACGLAAGQSLAACPEDIAAFEQRLQQTLAEMDPSDALTEGEMDELKGLLTAAEALQSAGNTEACATVISRAEILLDSSIAPKAVDPESLVGLSLTNAAGEDLGEVEEILIDPASGRIAYLVVERGGFLGMGGEDFAMPWRAVRYIPGEEALLLDIGWTNIENAPRFSREDRSALGERKWALAVHSFYGVTPYWQEQSTPTAQSASRAGEGQQAAQQAETQSAEAAAQSDTASGAAEPSEGGAGQATAQEESDESRSSQLAAQIAQLKQRMDRQAQSIDELLQMEQRFNELQSSDERIAQQMQQLSGQFGDVEQQLNRLSAHLQQAGANPGNAAQGAAAGGETQQRAAPGVTDQEPASASSKQGSSREAVQGGTGGADQQTSGQAGASGQAGQQAATSTGAGDAKPKCADEVAKLEQEIDKSEDEGQPADSVASAREQLKVAAAMANQEAEQPCLAAVEKARQELGLAQSEQEQQTGN